MDPLPLAFASLLCVIVGSYAQSCADKMNGPECLAWKQYCKDNDFVQQMCKNTCDKCRGPSIRAAPKSAAPATCRDTHGNCPDWVSADFSSCRHQSYIRENCKRSCLNCKGLPPEYDPKRLPAHLRPLRFLLGRWRSEHDGKARFPTIPVFTYGEQLDFTIAEYPRGGAHGLNYTAFAWGINEANELHSEYGFVALQNGTDRVALTTVMSNGFVTVEEGRAIGNSMTLTLKDIGRISFSRDLPVHRMTRDWTLISSNTLEQILAMETLTHHMQEHTSIRYKKVPIV